jgi:hypothetical protein
MKRTSRANKGAGSAKKRRHPKPVGRPFGQPYPALYYKVVYLVFACKIPQDNGEYRLVFAFTYG